MNRTINSRTFYYTVKKYNNQSEKFPRGTQQQIWSGEKTHKLKDRLIDIVQFEKKKEKQSKTKMKRNEQRLRDLWDKHNIINIMWVPEREKEKKASERIFEEIITKSSPNLVKNMYLPTHKALGSIYQGGNNQR